MNDRENEIYKQGAKEVKNTYAFIHDEEFSCADMADMFLKGAIYADQHPKEGLWNANKVISFLKEHASVENSSNINIHINGSCYHFVDDFIKDLQKAMED